MNLVKVILIVFLLAPLTHAYAVAPKQEYYQIQIYHIKTDTQEKAIDDFLQKALIPALHRQGIKNIGVFKPIETDTSDRMIFVVVPFSTINLIVSSAEALEKDKEFQNTGKDYLNAAYNDPPYKRVESIILKAFSHNPVLQLPELKGPRTERVYELRSYEGPTEKIFKNKVHMFNEGGEVTLFKRLGFNAVFYAEVVAGSRMPNLMYMTTFENKESRDQHWKAFGADAEWKRISSMPEYQNNVSKIDILFLRPTEYSDY